MTGTGTAAARRRGRPPRASDAQREVLLDAAFALLAERGYQGTTMGAVAERAGSSRETLHAWFDSNRACSRPWSGARPRRPTRAVAAALDGGSDPGAAPDPAETLTRFATGLLGLLLGERSVAINRAALAELDGELAAVLLGEEPPAEAAIAAQAHRAVERFLTLTGDPR